VFQVDDRQRKKRDTPPVRSDWIRLAVGFAVSPLLVGQTTAPIAPFISSVSPTAARANASVTLTGGQFTADNTVVFGAVLVRHIHIDSAIGIACTTDLNCRSGIIQSLKFKVPAKATAGPTKVSVKNANGTSNAVAFIVLK